MSEIKPALISRMYKTVAQRRLSDAVLLLTQIFDGNHLDPDSRYEHYLESLRKAGDLLNANNQLRQAEEHYALALALYDRFFTSLHHEGIAAARRLSEIYVSQGREADLARTLDHAYLVIQRISASRKGEEISNYGVIADELVKQHRIAQVAQGTVTKHARQMAGGNSRPIKVLLVEDSPEDADLVQETFSGSSGLAIVTEWAEHLNDGLQRLKDGGVDVVVLDLTLPDSHSLDTLVRIHQKAPTVPIVVLTGLDDKEIAVQALKAGAKDYLVKGRADAATLVRSIVAVMEDHLSELPKTPPKPAASEQVAALIKHSPLPMFYLTDDLKMHATNAAFDSVIRANAVGTSLETLWPQLKTEIINGTIAGGAASSVSLNLPAGSHATGTVTVSVWPDKTPDGQAQGLIGCITSMQDLRRRRTVADSLRSEIEAGQREQSALRSEILQQRALAKVSQHAQQNLSLPEMYEVAAHELSTALSAVAAAIFQINESSEIALVGASNIDATQWGLFSTSLGNEQLYQGVLNQTEPFVIEQISAEKFGFSPKVFSELGYHACALCPIPGEKQPYGILAVFFTTPRAITAGEQLFLTAMANITSTAIKRDHVQQRFQHVSDDLRRSNNDLQQFASAAAHDLQEPLRSVVSYLELLEGRINDQLDEKGQKYMGITVKAAKRMQVLINDLLEYSRVNSRGKALEATDCEQIVQFVIADLRLAIEDSHATIHYDELPVVQADSSQLTIVFQNLIANAIKFRGEAPPNIVISCKLEEHQYVFSIQDNGIGFDMEYADRIFLIFQRLHGRQKYSGTGIGLALCKKIIERHGGAIWVDSAPGKGSTFHFSIPAR